MNKKSVQPKMPPDVPPNPLVDGDEPRRTLDNAVVVLEVLSDAVLEANLQGYPRHNEGVHLILRTVSEAVSYEAGRVER